MRTPRAAYLLLLVAALSCRKQEASAPEDARAIRFSAVAPAAVSVSKAPSEFPSGEEVLFSDGNVIGVFGTWLSPENVSTDVFSKIPLTCYEDTPGEFRWDYSPHKYWRQGGFYDFNAVFPRSAAVQYGTNGNKLVITYSMHADNYDLMVASAERDLRVTDDTSPVNLLFRHGCAAIRFLFSKGSDTNHYYLDSFSLGNLHTVGILVYNGGEVHVSDWNSAEYRTASVLEWQAASEAGRIDVPEDYADLSADGWDNWHFAVPQNMVQDDGVHPLLRFSAYVNDDTVPVSTVLSLPETYAGGDPVIWEPGKVYTYYIQIQPSDATVTLVATPWESSFAAVDDISFGG